MVRLRIGGPPESKKVPRQTARGADDGRGPADDVVDRPDDRRLAGVARGLVDGPQFGHQAVPFRLQVGDPRSIGCRRSATAGGAERVGQRGQRCARIAHDRHSAQLGGVTWRDVHVDERDVRILEARMGRRDEVTEPRADREDDVGFAGEAVGCQ